MSPNDLPNGEENAAPPLDSALACFVMLAGIFLMAARIKALAQVIGLLLTENGVFLAATIIPCGMPFFVEIAIFFDACNFQDFVGSKNFDLICPKACCIVKRNAAPRIASLFGRISSKGTVHAQIF